MRMVGREDIFTVSDAGFFVGTVALLNSLRLTGNVEPVTVLDCGFSDEQRAMLDPHCRLTIVNTTGVGSPAWLKPFPHLLDPKGTVVVVDSDAIITGSLRHILDEAAGGRVCAFAATPPLRWFAEWEQLFDLPFPPRHQPYVTSGFVAFSTTRWPQLLGRWWQSCERWWERAYIREQRSDPLKALDQDALNALLMTELPQEALNVLAREADPFGRLLEVTKVVDARSLRCDCRGTQTILVQNSGPRRPWDHRPNAALRNWRPSYVRLLRRVLLAPDLEIQLPEASLPLWLRSSLLGSTTEHLVSLGASARYRARRLRLVSRRL